MINKKLKDEIWDYCRLNDITDVNVFIERMVRQGYNIEKYGTAPIDLTPEVKEVEKIVEKEVIKEVIKEVPVEVIKEVEVVKEVPVEVVKTVEKVVEKEVYVTDDEIVNKLQKELEERTQGLQNIIDGMKKDEEASSKIWQIQDKNINILEDELSDAKDKIWELEKELKEEKAKPKREKKEIKLPESTNRRSSITWVSKDERDTNNLYDD